MFRKSGFVSLRNFCLMSFTLIIGVVFILGIGTTSAQAAKKTDAAKGVAALVDINSVTQKELEGVKGVGAATAKKIIANRPYKSVDELSKAGLKAKEIAAIKPFVTVGKASAAPAAAAATADIKNAAKDAKTKAAADVSKATADVKSAAKDVKEKSKSAVASKLAPGAKVNINTADQAAIEQLPGIGAAKAKAIIEGRPYKTVEDIMKVKGIKGKTFDAIKDYIVVK